MLASVLGELSSLVTAILGAMSGIIVLWPIAVMVGFLILGLGIGYVKKLAGKRKGGKRRRP